MMMIAPNSVVRQKKGAQEEEEAEGQRKGVPTGNLTLGTDAPTGPTTWSGVLDARNRRKHGRWCGVSIHRHLNSFPTNRKMDFGLWSI